MINDFLWKYVDIDATLINDIKKQFLNVMPSNDDFFQSIKLNVSEFMGMKIHMAVLIQVQPGTPGRIHTDFRADNNVLALNIPLLNCEGSLTQMWESDYIPQKQHTDNGQPYNLYDRDRCTKIAEFELTRPVLFRTDLPHCVYNPTDKVRTAISLRFKTDPWNLVQ